MAKDLPNDYLHDVVNTSNAEIACAVFFEQLSRFTELEAAGHDAASQLPAVTQHLAQCAECEELHQALLFTLRSR